MRVLVTGATGFVGRELTNQLVDAGCVVVGISRSGCWPSGFAPACRIEQVDLADADGGALGPLLRRKQPEVIYHLAAQSNPSLSLSDPRGTWAANLGGTLNLLEALRTFRVAAPQAPVPRVVVVSSGVCYGNPAPEHEPVDELCPLRPNNPYAASKGAADLLAIQHFLAHQTDVVIARPFNHAGPGQSPTYVLASLCRQVAEVEAGQREFVEHGNLAVVRDFTDVRDIARAYRLLAAHGRAGEIYNVGTGREESLSTMFEIIKSMARTPIPSRVDPARVRGVDQPRLLSDSTKLRTATGWSPQVSLEQTLADMLNDSRKQLGAPR